MAKTSRGNGYQNRIQPLLVRINDQTAFTKLESLLDAAAYTPGNTWAQTTQQQTLCHMAWLAQMYQLMANAVLGSSPETDQDLTDTDLDYCSQLCDKAEELMNRFVADEARVEVNASIQQAKLESLALPSTLVSSNSTWRVLEAVQLQVVSDLGRLDRRGVPARYDPVYKILVQEMAPISAVFTRVSQQREQQAFSGAAFAIPASLTKDAKTVFELGQKAYAPFLFGTVYTDCRDRPPTLQDTEERLGFSPWLLTESNLVEELKKDSNKVRELITFWQKVPLPGEAQRLYNLLIDAVAKGHIDQRTGEGGATAKSPVPWATIYYALEEVTFEGKTFAPGQQCLVYATENKDGQVTLSIKGSGAAPKELWYRPPTIKDDDKRLAFTDPKLWADFQHDSDKVQEFIDLWKRIDADSSDALSMQTVMAVRDKLIKLVADMGMEHLPLWPYQLVVIGPDGVNLSSRHFDQGTLVVPYVIEQPDGTAVIEMRKSGKAPEELWNPLPTPQQLEQELGFDPWAFTAPAVCAQFKGDQEKWRELVKFWRSVQDIEGARAVQAWLQSALQKRALRPAPSCAATTVPWAGKFIVRRPVDFPSPGKVRTFLPGNVCCTLVVIPNDQGVPSITIKGSGIPTRAEQLGVR